MSDTSAVPRTRLGLLALAAAVLTVACWPPGRASAQPYPPSIAIYKDSTAWGTGDETALQALGFAKDALGGYAVYPTANLASGIPAGVQVVIIGSNPLGDAATADTVNSAAAQASLASFLGAGRVLVVHNGCPQSVGAFRAPGYDVIRLGTMFDYGVQGHVAAASHPIVVGPDGVASTPADPDDLTDALLVGDVVNPFHWGVLDLLTLPGGTTVILTADDPYGWYPPQPVMAEYAFNSGKVIITTVAAEAAANARLCANELAYATRGVVAVNLQPVAEAGADQTVTVPHDGSPATNTASVTVDGSASYDPEHAALTYEWIEGAAALGSTARVTVDLAAGTHTLTLKVTDPAGLSATDTVTITVNPEPNTAPVANAGMDASVEATGPLTTVTLDGSASADSDGDTLSYVWSEGTTVVGTSATVQAGLTVGPHTLTLTVTDPYGAFSTGSVRVEVKDTTPPALAGVPVDMDVTATLAAGGVATFALPTATDLVDGPVAVIADPAPGALFAPGVTPVTFTATDSHGNSASAAMRVNVTFSWSGFLGPLGSGSKTVFKLGSTIRVSFQLTGASAGITDLVAYFRFRKVSSSVDPGVAETSDTGGIFRYDPVSQSYVYKWGSKEAASLGTGTYEISADLGDGVSRTALIVLK